MHHIRETKTNMTHLPGSRRSSDTVLSRLFILLALLEERLGDLDILLNRQKLRIKSSKYNVR
jgi:hypothetical protein